MRAAGFDYDQRLLDVLAELGGTPESAPTTQLPPVVPGPHSVSVHLDTKDWVNLAKARKGRSDGTQFQAAYNYLRSNVANGDVRVVLSLPLYLEIALRIKGLRQRNDLADVMSEISRFQAINARHNLLEHEIECELHRRFGRPGFPRSVEVFGRGAYFASSGEHWQARLDSGGSGVVEQLVANDPIGMLSLMYRLNELMEWWMLRGPRDGARDAQASVGLEQIRNMDRERIANDEEFATMLRDNRSLRQHRDRVVLLRELYFELGREFVKLLARANMTIESFAWRSVNWILEFLDSLPVILVQSTLRRKNHANASRAWKSNDLRDFEQLSVAVPYCDVVVTERHSATILRQHGVGDRLSTAILDNVAQIPDVVEHLKASREP